MEFPSIKNFFTPKPAPKHVPDGKGAKETKKNYVQEGTELCAQTLGNNFSLQTSVHRIFYEEKAKQMNDPLLGQALATKKQQEISDNQSAIAQKGNTLEANNGLIERIRQEIDGLKEDIIKLVPDPGAVAKFRLCGSILLLLSAFLFVFYSSTFYSAFFRNFLATGTKKVGNAMFDPEAFVLSWQTSITQFLFVCLAPFIFMALGLLLHFFFEEKGLAKYIKSAAVLAVTLAFDILLAYKIEYNLAYVEWLTTNLDPDKSFERTFLQALADKDFWIVIFCGFVVYMIWGLLFNTTYAAYTDSTSTVHQKRALEEKIEDKQSEIKKIEQEKLDLQNEITQLESENKKLQEELANHVLWEPEKVLVHLLDFFTGWAGMMPALNKTPAEQQSAKETFDHAINVLFPQSATPVTKP